MKAVLNAAMLVIAATGAGAGEGPASTPPRVAVYVQGQQYADLALLNRARTLATSMFTEIGVRLEWKAGRPRPTRRSSRTGPWYSPGKEIVVRLAMEAPRTHGNAAPARALPYAPSGTQVTVFYDQAVPPQGDMGASAAFLAHILAHEIGHVLQGIARHSEAGVMKAQWSREDRVQMKNGPLRFSPHDGILIRSALVTNEK
jgi:hypothetical protein